MEMAYVYVIRIHHLLGIQLLINVAHAKRAMYLRRINVVCINILTFFISFEFKVQKGKNIKIFLNKLPKFLALLFVKIS
jgi:hypothetical protein